MPDPSTSPALSGEVHEAIDYLEGRVQALETTLQAMAERLSHALSAPVPSDTAEPLKATKDLTAPLATRVDGLGQRVHRMIMAASGLLGRLEI